MMLHHPYTQVLRRAGFMRLTARSTQAAWQLALMPDGDSAGVPRELAGNERARIHLTEGDSPLI